VAINEPRNATNRSSDLRRSEYDCRDYRVASDPRAWNSHCQAVGAQHNQPILIDESHELRYAQFNRHHPAVSLNSFSGSIDEHLDHSHQVIPPRPESGASEIFQKRCNWGS
jgi:hypothetical protein